MSTRTALLLLLTSTLSIAASAQKIDPAAWTDYRPEPSAFLKRSNQRWPLSDQKNSGGWSPYKPFWDEFDGKILDPAKWIDHNPTWTGREPGWFNPANVTVEGGCLCLKANREEPAAMPRDMGYHTWTTAAVQSRERTLYGYYEVRAKPMRSRCSSSFWFYCQEPQEWTEIDVFEIGGGAPGFERKQHITLHVMKTPTSMEHLQLGSAYNYSADLADDFHVYGVEWNETELRFYFDGALVREGPNTHWHQALTLNFDSETMPEWFGLPKLGDEFPAVFRIDYVRAWKKKSASAESVPKAAITRQSIAALRTLP